MARKLADYFDSGGSPAWRDDPPDRSYYGVYHSDKLVIPN